jgi:phosphoribosylanthranilate isomerase
MTTRVKICGLTTEETVRAAVDAGATHIGFNFFPPSPRYVTPARAGELAREVPEGVEIVALFVDPDDALLDAVVAACHPTLLQLHGKETPERVAAVKARFGIPVMKAARIADAGDIAATAVYDGIADCLLFDAKPPKDKDKLPGGNGVAFDWRLMADWTGATPWMLAGGLEVGNVAEAIRLTGAKAVDTSSGVEDAPGVKNAEKIKAFVAAASSAPAR